MEKIVKEKFKVAVIEDDEVMSRAISDELEEAGFLVVKAFDGEAGLQLVLTERPDVILLDIVMPRMDGMTVMRKLRESHEYGKKTPIILLTNLNADDTITRGVVKDEPSFYLVKADWSVADVVQKVKECIAHL